MVADDQHRRPLECPGPPQLLQPDGQVVVEGPRITGRHEREGEPRHVGGVSGGQELGDVTEHVLVLGQCAEAAGATTRGLGSLPERAHVVVDGRLFEAVEVGVERVQWLVLLNNNNVYQFLDYFSAQARKKCIRSSIKKFCW